MNQSIQCPICGKEGIPDFHLEDVVCPCCGSDLSIYKRLSEAIELKLINSESPNKNNRITKIIIGLSVVAILLFACLGYYKLTQKDDFQYKKESEIAELKGEISFLRDSISKLNTNIHDSDLSILSRKDSEADYRLYIVKKGDCIRKISRKQLGRELLFDEIATANNLASDAIIHPGDTLKIPNK